VIQDGLNGVLVPNGDVAALADGVMGFLADPGKARQMGAALRDTLLDTMSPERLDAHERSQYERVLGGGTR
jgi:hypothetical protein